MRVVLVNKFGPPSDAPTARVVAQLADAFRAIGYEVEIVATSETYRGSSRGLGRAIQELLALGGMFAGLLRSRRADCWIVLSSPPGLIIPVALAAQVRRVKISHWVMDLYPETAVAFGVLRRGGLLHSLFRAAMNWALKRCDKVCVLDSDMQERISVEADVLPLWPLEAVPTGEPSAPKNWIYSGNLGRAHEWRPLLEIQKLLETRGSEIRLIFQARGGELQHAKAQAKEMNLDQVEWNEFASPETFAQILCAAGALIVTQRLEAKGCVWPSKLAVAARISRPLFWIGPNNGAVAHWLEGRPGTGIFLPSETEKAANWLTEWCGRGLPVAEWNSWLACLPLTTPSQAAKRLLE